MVGLERLLIGRTLAGRYAVEELIGRGRGGLVYRARDARSGAEVALKVLAAPQSAEGRERYRRLVAGEVGIAAGIEHPNVLAVHALGVDPELDLDFVASELARGQTLGSVLAQRGNPPLSLGLRLLSDAADGLAAGHRAGLVHRDVRPASLYLVRSEAERQVRVKVGGFGVPQLVRREAVAAAPPEVSAYASPEMLANGSARLTSASDVFGLGVVGFQLMTGALPFDDEARRALAAGGTAEPAVPSELSPAVPPHVFEAVLQALRVAPADRFADATAFADALRQPASRPTVAVPAMFAAGKIPPASQEAPVAALSEAAASTDTLVVSDDLGPSPEASLAEAAAPPAEPAETFADAVDRTHVDPPAAVPDAVPAAGFVALAGGLMEMDDAPSSALVKSPEDAVAASTAAQEPAAAPVASPAAAAPPPAPSAPATAHTRKAPMPRGVPADLDLYYPPQRSATPTPVSHPGEVPASPVAMDASLPAPAAAAPAIAPLADEQPRPVAVPRVVEVAAAPIATDANAPAAPAPIVAPRAVSIGGKRRAGVPGRAGGFRGSPAMAAGFVLGMLVLGTVGWMATRHPSGTDAASTEKLAATSLVPAAAAAAGTPTAAAPGSAPQPAATPARDSVAQTPEERRRALEEAKKRQQDEARKKQQDDQARLALLQQQQAAATAQAAQQPAARPEAAPPPVQQPVAAVPRPAPPAPPPPPPPAPAPAREEPAPVRAAAQNEVFSTAEVEERPRLSNAGEIQRALQMRYPDQLAAARVSGAVTATFVVSADGHVEGSSIRIVGSPNPAFNVPTQNVLRRARFRPATVGGRAVRVQVTMPVQWTAPQ